MIEFAEVPDEIFLAIFDAAMEHVRETQLVQFVDGYQPSPEEEQELDEFYRDMYPGLVPFFTRLELVS